MKTTHKSYRGAAAIELAFVLPVFLLVIFGIVEFGRAFMTEHLLANGARLGARTAIIEGSTNSQVTQKVTDFCVNTLAIASEDVFVDIEDETGTAIDLSTAAKGDLCRVRVGVAFDNVSFVSGTFLQGAELGNACLMEHE